LGPLFDAAEAVGGELAARCRSGAPREVLFAALMDELRSAGNDPEALSVYAIEDLHWADDSTLDLVRFLGRRVGELHTLLLVTYRDDGLTADDSLRSVLGELASQRSTRRISVGPLSQGAVEELARGSAIEAAQLYRLTGGNPFFVTEVLQTGSAEIPESVRHAGAARMAALSPRARDTVQVAALIGTRVGVRLLQAVADPDAATLDEIVDAGVMVSDGDSLRFRHEITRMAVEQLVAAHRRVPTHGLILRALVAAGCEDDAQLAHHAEGAADQSAVLRYAPRAGRRAAALSSHREAAAQYERALRFVGGQEPAVVASLYDRLADELSLIDRWQGAADARERSLALWQQLGDRLREGDALRRQCRTLWRLSRGKEAIEAAEQAIVTLEPLGPSAEITWAHSTIAFVQLCAGQFDDADRSCRRAVELAERFDLPDALSDALNTASLIAHDTGRAWEPMMRQALSVGLTRGAAEHAGRAYSNLCELLRAAMRLDEAEAVYREGVVMCEEHDISTYLICLRARQIEILSMRGEWDEAAAVARQLLLREASPMNRLTVLAELGLILARRDEGAAWELLDQALGIALDSAEANRISYIRLARAEAFWLAGRDAELRHELELAGEVVHPSDPWSYGELAIWTSRAGMEPAAGAAVSAARPYALALAGDHAAAVRFWADLRCPYAAALAMLDSADDASMREAVRRFDTMGATAAGNAARREMRRRGVRSIPAGVRSTTRSNPHGLTNRELEVLSQISLGRTNADIAAALFISAKTVDHHVSAVLTKLGVGSRMAAAAQARELGLATT
jgi:DNA-binding CsgD family transcriptional regulator/tetratricopeptide (TPR) repeat protein